MQYVKMIHPALAMLDLMAVFAVDFDGIFLNVRPCTARRQNCEYESYGLLYYGPAGIRTD